MSYHNKSKEKLIERNQEEREHSQAYELFLKQKDSKDYAIKREGYQDDLLDMIYPEERKSVESIIVTLFEQQDVDVLKFMKDLTTVDGISIVEEQYKRMSEQVIDKPNIARYLYTHTKKPIYLEDLRGYCFDGTLQQREEAIKNLSTLAMDVKREEIPLVYEVSRLIIMKENDSELLFWAKAIMRKCIKRLDIIGDNEQLRKLWEEVEDAIKKGSCEIRTEKLLAFEEKIISDNAIK